MRERGRGGTTGVSPGTARAVKQHAGNQGARSVGRRSYAPDLGTTPRRHPGWVYKETSSPSTGSTARERKDVATDGHAQTPGEFGITHHREGLICSASRNGMRRSAEGELDEETGEGRKGGRVRQRRATGYQ